MTARPAVLSIHAADNLGEEGILVDAAVCAELQCRFSGIVTSILASRPGRVDALEPLSLGLVAQQLESVLATCRPAAVRVGLVVDRRQASLVADLVTSYGLPSPVVAPVVKIGGTRVLSAEGLRAAEESLYPAARVVVIRAGDLDVLAGRASSDVDGIREAAEAVRQRGARSVLVAGAISRGRVLDLLDEEGHVSLFDASRVAAPRLAGASGAHAAALTAHLARGQSLVAAVSAAQRYIAFRLQRLG